MTHLLDTHVLVWWFLAPNRLSRDQALVLDRRDETDPLVVSDISLWEIATLVHLNRIELDLPVRDWLERATAPPLVRRVGISPAIAGEVSVLPASFHRDPADRILVATARQIGAALLTRDERIIRAGLVQVIQ